MPTHNCVLSFSILDCLLVGFISCRDVRSKVIHQQTKNRFAENGSEYKFLVNIKESDTTPKIKLLISVDYNLLINN